MKKLTVKQEKFAQLVATLGNQSEAYRQAYDVSENIKDETVYKRSSELMSNGVVSGRVDEFLAESAKRTCITIDSIAEGLLGVINDVDYTLDLGKLINGDKEEVKVFYRMKDMNTVSDKLKAYDMLIKLYGLSAPEKHEHTITSHKTNWG